MYVSKINNIAFAGKTRYLSCNSEGKSKTVSDYPFGTAVFGDTKGLSEMVKKRTYPFATIEETVGKFHDNSTYKIYVADPFEKVTDIIRKNHDYIVYDCEPKIPDIQESYFNSDVKFINRVFKEVQSYLQRLEATNSVQSKNVEQKKKLLAGCMQIYNEGLDLMEQKKELDDKISVKKEQINELRNNIMLCEADLQKKRAYIANHECNLITDKQKLSRYKKQKALLINNPKTNPKIIEKLDYKIKRCKQRIDFVKLKTAKYYEKIEYCTKYISTAPKLVENLENDVKTLSVKLNQVKVMMQPIFQKLYKFYTTNGIKIIHKM